MRTRQGNTRRNTRQDRLLVYDRPFTPVSEEQSKLFARWELLNRGWHLAPHPVNPEPVFRPFKRQSQPDYGEDDGRQPSFFKLFRSLFTSKPAADNANTQDAFVPFTHTSPLQKITIAVTNEHAFETENIQRLLALLCRSAGLLAFEIFAANNAITLQVVSGRHDMAFVEAQLKAFLPHCIIAPPVNAAGDIIGTTGETASIDFGLEEEFMRPITMEQAANYYTGLFAVLDRLGTREGFVYQMLFKGVAGPWKDSIIKSVTTVNGDSFFVDCPTMPRLAKDKVGSQLLHANIRVMATAPTKQRAGDIIRQATAVLANAAQSAHNTIMPLEDRRYPLAERLGDIQNRTTRRGGMLLNIQEATSFFYIPPVTVSDKLRNTHRKTKAAPLTTVGHPYVLGTNSHHGITKTVSLDDATRSRHTIITGQTGAGKSVLLFNLICQDILNGKGFCLIEPHNDLIEKVLSAIPESRKRDVVLIDPSDTEYPVACNMLHAKTDIEKQLVSSDLVALFKRYSTSWGDQIDSVLANSIDAFVESTRGGTLADLRRFLVEKQFRNEFIPTIQDDTIRYYWQKEFPLLRHASIGSIVTRLNIFLRPKITRNMVSQREGLPIAEWMDKKKIVLIKLAQGLIGAENSHLLGALMVSKIHQAALARQQQQQGDRVPFTLYLDESDCFITPSLKEAFQGSRKYALNLVIAFQNTGGFPEKYEETILANANTRVLFKQGEADAKKFADGLSYFNAEDLQNLAVGEAIARVGRAVDDFSLDIQPNGPPSVNPATREYIVAQTRQKYASHISALKETVPDITIETKPVKPAGAAPAFKTMNVGEVPENVAATNKKEGAGPSINIGPDTANEEKQQPTEHRYWQTLIKQTAEANGYRAAIEAPVMNGKVDVLLEKDNKTIACEISVTTDTAWEMHNIRKCLQVGFTTIASISPNEKFLASLIKKAAEAFSPEEQQKILVLSPQQLLSYLHVPLSAGATKPATVKGYRVKVQYGGTAASETKLNEDLLDKIYRRKN